jgi:DNA-binding response OmpR family regulator
MKEDSVPNKERRVLILEDDLAFLTLAAKGLRKQLDGATILTARSVSEAHLLIAEYSIDFFILDVQLPDGSGLDFLCDLRIIAPESGVVVVTATPLPEYRTQAQGLGVIQFLEKPVHPTDLAELVHNHFFPRDAKATVLPANRFCGAFSNLTPLDIIQLKCIGNATQTLEFISGSQTGRVFIRKGELVHAETETSRGLGALKDILSWRGGRVVELSDTIVHPLTLNQNWQATLLEAVQAIDEQAAPQY